MEWLTKELLISYGPLALGWIYAAWLQYRLMDLNKVVTRLVERQTEALTRLTTLFDERLPRRGAK
jgi:hypothetical protein